jgi:hypothetical protein
LIFALLIFASSLVILFLKINDVESFLNLFKEWVWLVLGLFAVYTGGNISSKYVHKKNPHNLYHDTDWQSNYIREHGDPYEDGL